MNEPSWIQPVDILLVADNNEEIALLQESFAALRFLNIMHAVTGREQTFAYLRQRQQQGEALPQLILLDLDLDPSHQLAFEILSELKGDPGLRPIPVAMLARSAAEAEVLRAYSHGACTCVTKPVSLPVMQEVAKQFAQYWALVSKVPRPSYAAEESFRRYPEMLVFDRAGVESIAHEEPVQPVDILLVDDNEDDILLLEEAFAESNLVNLLHVVRNGEEALAYLRQEKAYPEARRPGLVLLDINMPCKNGFEVLTEIHADSNLRTLPVVMLTSSNREADIVRSYTNGACSYVAKPVGFEQLYEVTQQLALYWALVAYVPRCG